jgi:mxaJ protein
VAPAHAPAGLPVPFEYSIAMGVRKGDTALRDRLDGIIERHQADIDAILASYSVPTVPMPSSFAKGGQP